MSAPALRTAQVELEIPFHDLDPAGYAWHGNYAKYLEIARCELLKHIDYNYDVMLTSGYLWPVIDMQLRYIKPLRFRDRMVVQANLVEWEYRLRIEYVIRDVKNGQRLTRASTVQVAVNINSGEMCLRSPNILFEKLGLEP